MQATTIQSWRQEATIRLNDCGHEDTATEVRQLLHHFAHIEVSEQIAFPERVLDSATIKTLNKVLEQRCTHTPLAYLIGTAGFFGHEFFVGSGVLIPRPETEILVTTALEEISQYFLDKRIELRILDTCAGTGCIGLSLGIALLQQGYKVQVDLVECDEVAFGYLNRNVHQLQASSWATAIQGDLWSQGATIQEADKYDLIVANPPYIGEFERAELMRDVVEYEPEMALFAAKDGMAMLERIVGEASLHLKDFGVVLLEHGYQQGEAVTQLIKRLTKNTAIIKAKDYLGFERVTGYRVEE